MLYLLFAENVKHTDKKKKPAIQIDLEVVTCFVGGCQ